MRQPRRALSRLKLVQGVVNKKTSFKLFVFYCRCPSPPTESLLWHHWGFITQHKHDVHSNTLPQPRIRSNEMLPLSWDLILPLNAAVNKDNLEPAAWSETSEYIRARWSLPVSSHTHRQSRLPDELSSTFSLWAQQFVIKIYHYMFCEIVFYFYFI